MGLFRILDEERCPECGEEVEVPCSDTRGIPANFARCSNPLCRWTGTIEDLENPDESEEIEDE